MTLGVICTNFGVSPKTEANVISNKTRLRKQIKARAIHSFRTESLRRDSVVNLMINGSFPATPVARIM